jgi:glycosyltransferase involved in cell wall biosynthesis
VTGPPRIGVVVPARDEAALLPACLDGLAAATRGVAAPADVRLLVVLDDCRDDSAEVVAGRGVDALAITAGCVGAARAAGCAAMLADGVDWLACTDADSVVPSGWLAEHLAALAEGFDALVGTVRVDAWEDRPDGVRLRHHATYAPGDAETHPHVHGANLGVAAPAYRRAGGFAPLATAEDVALVEALERTGARIRRTRAAAVLTSARRRARARGGFADHLSALEVAP